MSEVQFNNIPVNFLVPGVYAEFNAARANSSALTIPPSVLHVGQKLAAGSAAAGVPVRVTSADQVGALAGRGSMLHQMARKHFAASLPLPLTILPLSDKAGATKAAQTVTITGAATQAGTLALHVGDTRYAVPVAAGATATAAATAVVAAITADADRYADAGNAAGVITLTARHGGIEAGKVDALLNRYADDATPTGLTVVIGARAEGTVNPDLPPAIAALGTTWHTAIVAPYTDSTSLGLVKAELLDRFGPIRQIDAYAYVGWSDSVANLVAAAAANNAPWQSLVDTADLLTPGYVVAAAVAAQDAAEPDPGRPRQTLALPGVLARPVSSRRTVSEQQQLIAGGVSTLQVDDDGTVRIQRLTTTYRTNSFGVTDNSYFDTESMHLLATLRYSARVRFASKYPRHKLGRDGSVGPNVMTPAVARAEWIALYVDVWLAQGWVEGGTALEQFKADLRVEIDAGDPNRLNSLVPPDLINQLRVQAAQFAFLR